MNRSNVNGFRKQLIVSIQNRVVCSVVVAMADGARGGTRAGDPDACVQMQLACCKLVAERCSGHLRGRRSIHEKSKRCSRIQDARSSQLQQFSTSLGAVLDDPAVKLAIEVKAGGPFRVRRAIALAGTMLEEPSACESEPMRKP